MEIEVKINLNETEVKRLISILGEPQFFEQENIIYKTRSGFLRIRSEKDKIILTLKGKNEKSEFNKREEIEFQPNSDKKSLIKFCSILGLNKTLSYKKQRADYHFKNCTISIDLLPDNKKFLEIEGSELNIKNCLSILKLEDKELEHRSYLEILNEE